MAVSPTTNVPVAWASAIADVNALHQQLTSAADSIHTLEDRLIASEHHQVDLPASTLAGATCQLDRLWEDQLHSNDRASSQKPTILDGLQRIAAA